MVASAVPIPGHKSNSTHPEYARSRRKKAWRPSPNLRVKSKVIVRRAATVRATALAPMLCSTNRCRDMKPINLTRTPPAGPLPIALRK